MIDGDVLQMKEGDGWALGDRSSQSMMQIRVEMEAELQKRPCDSETSGARGLFLTSRTMCPVHPVCPACPVQCQLPPGTVDLSLSTCHAQQTGQDRQQWYPTSPRQLRLLYVPSQSIRKTSAPSEDQLSMRLVEPHHIALPGPSTLGTYPVSLAGGKWLLKSYSNNGTVCKRKI